MGSKLTAYGAFASENKACFSHHRLALASLLTLAVSLTLMSCRSESASPVQTSEGGRCPTGPIRMAVAASLREVALAITGDLRSTQPNLDVVTSYGASSALARQIELGAPIDILVSADEAIVRRLARAGWLDEASIRHVATGELILASRLDSPFAKLGADALASPSVKRLGLPSAAVPLGRYGRAWLTQLGVLEDFTGRIAATENARANLTALDQGHVDLAILYASDLQLSTSLVALARPEGESGPPIRYVAARAPGVPGCDAADRVLDAWQTHTAQVRLTRAGFDVESRAKPMEPR